MDQQVPSKDQWSEFAWIGLGANLGELHQTIRFAHQELQKLSDSPLLQSAVYDSEPWGIKDQPVFINQVIGLIPKHDPITLLQKLLDIEKQCQRLREHRWGPRTLDLDLLVWKDVKIQSEFLTLPHPRLHLRKFVLIPWFDIGGNLYLPALHQDLEKLIQACPDQSWVKKCNTFSLSSS
jgi:2-amino-4-hydroxy-6-hydroxymethyldihydropteridine diphosphokinase